MNDGSNFGGNDMWKALATSTAIIWAATLGSCTTARLTEPTQTSTEQLLISTAIDRAVEKLKPSLPAGAGVYVDTTYFDTAPADGLLFPKYAIGAVRDQLLRDGARLVADKKDADVVVELRTGGQSIDHNTLLVGIPSFPVPVPFTSNAVFPEIALFKRDRQTGVAKLAVTVYSESTGQLRSSSGPQYGASDHTSFSLLFYSWTHNDIEPEDLHGRTH